MIHPMERFKVLAGAFDYAPDFECFAAGIPRPQGSKIRTRYGMRDASDYLTKWRATVAAAALLQRMERRMGVLDGPLVLGVEFLFERPQKHYHWTISHGVRMRQDLRADAPVYVTGKPDKDKLVRAVGDALVAAGVVKDDSLFVRDHPSGCKRYANPGEQPGARIRIWRVT